MKYLLVLVNSFSAGMNLYSCRTSTPMQVPAQSEVSSGLYPGSLGGGSVVTGGKGGVVLYVNTLEDDVGLPGTLRWAIHQSGPRTILFKVAGVIRLKSELKINKGNITIAGESMTADQLSSKSAFDFVVMPVHTATEAYHQVPVDTDADGIPDDWEKTTGLNPFDLSDGSLLKQNSVYTWLELYLFSIVKHLY